MTYRIDRSQFIENGPTLAAATAIARVRKVALYAALAEHREADDRATRLPKAA